MRLSRTVQRHVMSIRLIESLRYLPEITGEPAQRRQDLLMSMICPTSLNRTHRIAQIKLVLEIHHSQIHPIHFCAL